MYLNCHSYHSLRYGTIPVKLMVHHAQVLGISALALTDINSISGVYELLMECRGKNIKPLAGVEIRVEENLYYIVLAKNLRGLAQVNKMLTQYQCHGVAIPRQHPPLQDVFLIYPRQNAPETLAPHEFIGWRPAEINMLVQPEWQRQTQNMVIWQPVTYTTKEDYNLHAILRAIEHNTLLSKLRDDQVCGRDEFFQEPEKIAAIFKNHPEILANTQSVIDGCHFSVDFSSPKNKKHFTESRDQDEQLLRRLASEGLKRRYPQDDGRALKRMNAELDIIFELNFAGYFLITWDIVEYSRRRGFMHVGRGSGANSIVSYCIGITEICPLELDLYFERFLNLNRKIPPDFDIDWSWQERDEILRYIFDRYGEDHVAFCGTNVQFKYRSIVREVGKAFGLPKEELDALTAGGPGQKSDNPVVHLVQKYGRKLERFPNQRSMHACGILISEEPITTYSALELPPKGFPIVQFDMHVAEDLGFEKFDILSQRGLGTIQDAVKLIQKNRGTVVDIRNGSLTKNESRANEYLSRGETLGCFYIESPAMRGLLRRLKCCDYKTLVAASSIIRPGVAQSGMMKEYIYRHNHPGDFVYFHPVFEEHLGETYGIMVYQEDVIKIALHYGGISAADGDVLRRAMSGKSRSVEKLREVKDHFFECARAQGHPEELSAEVYRQIESFAGYSFCKAHSASYAVESYQSLYLKVYYPIEFMVAAINNGGGFYRTEVYIHECRRAGGIILNPCINRSEVLTTVYGREVYLGLGLIENLSQRLGESIVLEREKRGEFRSLEDFIKRIPVGAESLQTLIFIGAFRFTGKTKTELLLAGRQLLNAASPHLALPRLFEEPPSDYALPPLPRHPLEDAFDEIEILGFPVTASVFDLLQTPYRGHIKARQLVDFHKKQVKMLAYLISRKQVPTSRGDMIFGTWTDSEGDYFDTAHFADSLRQYPFQGGGCYLLLGVVEVDFHFPTVTIFKMAKMPFIPDPRYNTEGKQSREAERRMKEDVSLTTRKPYPRESGLVRHRKMGE